MLHRIELALALAVSLLLASIVSAAAQSGDGALVSLATQRGATVKILLLRPKANAVASVLLFAGGHGALGLESATSMSWGAGNFLVRTRRQFAEAGLQVAVVDAASDRPDGMNAIYRMSGQNVADITPIIDRMRAESDAPVWAVGTSMGSFSAAALAIAGKVDGVVLTSTVTRSQPGWAIASSHPHGVASMQLDKIKTPAFIVSHVDDACRLTPPEDADLLRQHLVAAPVVEIKMLNGGRPARSDACEAYAPHGFLGVEDAAVEAIASFVIRHSPRKSPGIGDDEKH